LTILGLESIEIITRLDIVSVDGDHTKLALGAASRKVGKGDTARPDVRHLGTEQGGYFGPKTRRLGNATEFTKVGYDIVAGIVAIGPSVGALKVGVTTPFTKFT